jgi:hypothetical protein
MAGTATAAIMGGMRKPLLGLERLRSLIGAEVRYQGMRCTLVDVLDEPAMVVLRPIGADPVIQSDTFGQPMRHAPPLYELPVFGPDGVSPSAELQMISLPATAPPGAD